MDSEVVDQSVPPPMLGAGPSVVPDIGDDPVPPESTIDEVDRLLDEVEAALARLDDGTYGACAACGAAIDDARLSREPTVRTCEACDRPASDLGPVEARPPVPWSVGGGPEG
jgi:Prokaryotic dksA/traR C4-type zinc finger